MRRQAGILVNDHSLLREIGCVSNISFLGSDRVDNLWRDHISFGGTETALPMTERPPRILVLQHIACEHPGIFRDFLAADGIPWDAVELDQGEAIPALDAYDVMLVMGGPMDVWQEDEHPWLRAEKAAIRDWVETRRKPYLGLCLGHQLLADALGGEVAPAAAPEVGLLEVTLTERGRAHRLFAGLPTVGRCLQWHSAEVKRPPAGAVVLASSPLCRVNAFAVGERAFGIQYHLELTPDTVGEWGAVPAYAASLDATLGAGALARLDAEAGASMAEFNAAARRLYDNFMNIVAVRA
jgi:GMP synthase-like glutamine amidotransferase